MKKVFLMMSVFILVSQIACSKQTKNDNKMNVVFIVVDDLKPMLECYGYKSIKTPNIDRLAANGILFENAYCQQAVCAASRVSLFSGLRPDNTKVWDLKTNMKDVNPSAVTIPQLFRNNGYITIGYGKLIHGAKNNDPTAWSVPYIDDSKLEYADGFSYPAHGFYQNKASQDAYTESIEMRLNWQKTNEHMGKKNARPSIECLDVPDNAYEDGAVTNAGIKAICEYGENDKPFFLALGFHKPHLPFVAPKKYWDLYDRDEIKVAPYQEKTIDSPDYAYHTWGELKAYSDIPNDIMQVPYNKQKELIHGYKACVSFVDSQIGKIIDQLEEKNLMDNTIIILCGDHGWHLGDLGIWCKHTNFEQATKVPFIMSVPNIQKNARANSFVEFVDLYPTLCELANIEPEYKLDGESLVPLLLDPKDIKDNYAVSQFPRGNKIMGYSIRDKQYRYTVWLEGRYREQAIYSDPNIVGEELYDYSISPNETRSYANDVKYTKAKERLKKELFKRLNAQ